MMADLSVPHDRTTREHPCVVVDVSHGVGEVEFLGPDQADPGLDAAGPPLHHPLYLDLE